MTTQIQAARQGLITPAEHLALPNEEDVREGVRVTRLAITRRDSRWEEHMDLLLFPDRAREMRTTRRPAKEETCTMCGDFCANRKGMELFKECLAPDKRWDA